MELNIFNWFSELRQKEPEVIVKTDPESWGTYSPIFTYSYNGEKTPGEMGLIKNYLPDYNALRARSWQSYLESEITQTVINKFNLWVIGTGLKLQSEPELRVLKQQGVTGDFSKFEDTIESRFKIYAKSKLSSHNGNDSLHALAKAAHINSIVGGDVLVVLRYEENRRVTVQLIDGAHVQSPIFNSSLLKEVEKRGNTIKHGVEVNAKGSHVAYFINTVKDGEMRVEAYNPVAKKRTAFLVYGLKYRLDEVRGIPLISAVMETLKKLDRYKEATVGSAEERQKIAFSIEHSDKSTGENPMAKAMAQSFNAGFGEAPETKTPDGDEIATKIATTTQKQAWNMPIGAQLKILESKNELYFKDFYTVNINGVCAALGIPPEVALSKYDSNFSASRAALKDWEHTVEVTREIFANDFYQNFTNLWFMMEVLNGSISAPGYITSLNSGDYMAVEAYQNNRFTGANIPHIDPLKEVQAERAKLGATAAEAPLTTIEAATEAVGGGDYNANIKKYNEEIKLAPKIEVPVKGK